MDLKRPEPQKKRWILGASVLLVLVLAGGVLYRTKLQPGSEPETAQPTDTSGSSSDSTAANPSTATAVGEASTDPATTEGARIANAPGTTPVDGVTAAGSDVTGGVVVAGGSVPGGAPASGAASAAAGASTGFLGDLRARVANLLGGGADGAKAPFSGAPGVETGSLAPSAPSELAREEAPKADISRDCFTETFVHKAVKSHSSGEACSQHRNVLRVSQKDINPKSVCVRVNGNPVRFQTGKPGEVVLGPIAGPDSKITVRYCMAKATLANCEDCRIPKDEFMEAIGGVAEDGSEGAAYVKWDPNEQGADADVAANLDPELKRELANATDLKLFDGWESGGGEAACHTKTAAKPAVTPNG